MLSFLTIYIDTLCRNETPFSARCWHPLAVLPKGQAHKCRLSLRFEKRCAKGRRTVQGERSPHAWHANLPSRFVPAFSRPFPLTIRAQHVSLQAFDTFPTYQQYERFLIIVLETFPFECSTMKLSLKRFKHFYLYECTIEYLLETLYENITCVIQISLA